MGQAEVLECLRQACHTPSERDHSYWKVGLSLGLPKAWLSFLLPTKTSEALLDFFAVRAPLPGCFYPGGVSSLVHLEKSCHSLGYYPKAV